MQKTEKQTRVRPQFDVQGALQRFPLQPDDALTRAAVVRSLFGEISEANLWEKVKNGDIPRPVDRGLWRVGDVREALAAMRRKPENREAA